MANAYKCDRCGVFYAEYKDNYTLPRIVKEYRGGRNLYFDLCEECKKDLELFLQNTPLVVNKEDTLYVDGVAINKTMTCKERLMIEHPEKVGNRFTGGCKACPDNYGYARRPDKCFPNRRGNDKECAECWDRAVEEV